MELSNVKVGLEVRITKLGDTRGMNINTEYLETRTINATGIIVGYVSGHGGDVWWIDHGNKVIGAYAYDEFEPTGGINLV